MRKEILNLLENDCRLSYEDLASMLGLNAEEVKKEIEALEEEKIIVGYRAIVNWEKVENELVSALIDVKITPQRDVGFDQIARNIYRFNEVKSVFLMSGDYDLSVQVEGKTLKEVAHFVAEKLASMDNVQSTATHFVLKKYKEAGVILEEEGQDKRQAIIL
jgi:DNA-binding Lrp family transcriptional regulator